MGCAKALEQAAYFRGMARRYERLAHTELSEAQSELFAAVAADYGELAENAAAATAIAEPAAAETGTFARLIHWIAGRTPAVPPLPPSLPLAPTGAK